MSEQYKLLKDDLLANADELHQKAAHARKSTAHAAGRSAFADRCHTLADAHTSAAMAYEKIIAEVESNLLKASP